MAGLVKAKNYDWKDSNIALFGSDTEKQVKKESAETEPAWEGAGQAPGLKIWRINQFQVEHVPEEDYGCFYGGDSYIILNTYTDDEGDKLLHDVHFWIGGESTQDEYGTAAYKTVELDTLLDGVPVQHREVQNHESQLFKGYFKTITNLEGGHKSGFRHVEPESYKPRLFLFKRVDGKTSVTQIGMYKGLINDGDVFILDLGLEILQLNGSTSSAFERSEAAKYVQKLESERNGRAVSTVIDGDDRSQKNKFMDHLEDGVPEGEDEVDNDEPGTLYKVSDASGEIEMTEVKSGGGVSADDLQSSDVFVVHVGTQAFVWVGSGASPLEKQNGLAYGNEYLLKIAKCVYIPLTVIGEGQKSKEFSEALARSA